MRHKDKPANSDGAIRVSKINVWNDPISYWAFRKGFEAGPIKKWADELTQKSTDRLFGHLTALGGIKVRLYFCGGWIPLEIVFPWVLRFYRMEEENGK